MCDYKVLVRMDHRDIVQVTPNGAVYIALNLSASEKRHAMHLMASSMADSVDQIRKFSSERDIFIEQIAALGNQNERLHEEASHLIREKVDCTTKLLGEIERLREQNEVLLATEKHLRNTETF